MKQSNSVNVSQFHHCLNLDNNYNVSEYEHHWCRDANSNEAQLEVEQKQKYK